MQSPGSITNSVPDPDKFIRNMRDIQRTAQENISSVPASFRTTVAALDTSLAALTTPLTAHASSTSIAFAFYLNAPITVPAGATRCFYIATASASVTASSGFQLAWGITAPAVGTTAGCGTGSATQGAGVSIGMGSLTGLVPGNTLNFTAMFGAVRSGTFTACTSNLDVMAVFQP